MSTETKMQTIKKTGFNIIKLFPGVKTLSIMTLCITTFSIMTSSIMTFSINDIQYK
jgi:hypothetical protein